MKKSIFKKKRILQDIVLLAVLAYFLFLLYTQQATLDRNIKEYEELKEKTEELRAENELLEKELETAGTDEYLENKIREVLGYVKSDETVFIEEKK